MSSYKPWSFSPQATMTRFTIFYGSDLALGLSLARCYKATFVENLTPQDLCCADIFGSLEPVKSIVDSPAKFLNLKVRTNRNCILICGKNVVEEKNDFDYIRCEPLNSRSRAWFVSYHCKRLNIQAPKDTSWINNLDDLHFAILLDKFGLAYQSQESEQISPWIKIRINQIRNKGDVGACWKHFEIWAKENSPSDEALQFYMEQMGEELSGIKSLTIEKKSADDI